MTPSLDAASFDSFVDASFFTDILLTFNTAYKDASTEALITDRYVIAKNYLKIWFWIDLISSIPLDDIFFVVVDRNSVSSVRLIRILRLVRLLKLVRVLKLAKIGGNYGDKLTINPAVLGVASLLFQIFFIAHLIACFWHFLTLPELADSLTRDGTTWVTDLGYESSSVSEVYIAAFYWTVTSMLSVGYGDIHATNNSERIYSMITMLSGGILFGAVIAQITRLIESRNPQAKAFKERMGEIKAYLQEKMIPYKLKAKAKVS